jgi:hypothetical protein
MWGWVAAQSAFLHILQYACTVPLAWSGAMDACVEVLEQLTGKETIAWVFVSAFVVLITVDAVVSAVALSTCVSKT